MPSVFGRFLKFGDGPTDAVLVNNAGWCDGLHYITMLRDIGRHFSVNQMLSFESVKSRLDRNESLRKGISIVNLMPRAGLTESRSEGRRLVQGGGARLNGVPFSDEKIPLSLTDFGEENVVRLSAGRKRHVVVRLRRSE